MMRRLQAPRNLSLVKTFRRTSSEQNQSFQRICEKLPIIAEISSAEV